MSRLKTEIENLAALANSLAGAANGFIEGLKFAQEKILRREAEVGPMRISDTLNIIRLGAAAPARLLRSRYWCLRPAGSQ